MKIMVKKMSPTTQTKEESLASERQFSSTPMKTALATMATMARDNANGDYGDDGHGDDHVSGAR